MSVRWLSSGHKCLCVVKTVSHNCSYKVVSSLNQAPCGVSSQAAYVTLQNEQDGVHDLACISSPCLY